MISFRVRKIWTAVAVLAMGGSLAAPGRAGLFDGLKKKKGDPFALAQEAKTAELTAKKDAHAPVKAGECSKCHADPKDPSKLTQEKKPLCLSCHESRALDLRKKTVHYAYAEMDCDACHLPHASDNPFLLSAPVNDLCSNCHDVKDEAIKKSHAGVAAFEGLCTGCHSPHASEKPKLILDAKEHIPFGSRSCDMCHEPTGGDGKPKLKATPGETCFVCHSNFRKLEENPVVHMPVAGGECALCHNPHVSVRSSLIKGPLDEICFQCHETWLKNNHPVTRHPTSKEAVADPRREGKPFNCASCHEPHAGKLPKLTRGDIFVMCKECHKK